MSLSSSEPSWEGINLSKSEWTKFAKSDIWKAFLFELEEREKYLIQLFKDSDKEWSPDVIKGKLTEIDFVRQIPALIMLSIEDKEKLQKGVSDEGSDE